VISNDLSASDATISPSSRRRTAAAAKAGNSLAVDQVIVEFE
jgi:hypothetical protein